MRHYYSIANFAVGFFTEQFNKFFYTQPNDTNQQLFGKMLVWSQGKNLTKLVNNNTIPQQFIDSWGSYLARKIATEFQCVILNSCHSNNWNGDEYMKIPLYLPKLIMDWSIVTTVTAGVLNTIDYYTNNSFLSWSNSIGLPNILMQNIIDGGETKKLVEKHGIDSIKPLHDAGAKFSDLYPHKIQELIERYGPEIKDKLLYYENIKDKIIANYIESLTANNVEQLETISTSDGDEIADQEIAV